MLRSRLRSVRLVDIQGFTDHLNESGLKPSSIHRAMSAVKSLFAFGFRLGYLQFDVGRAIKIPSFRDELAERILSEAEVLRIISLEPNPRNRAILLTLYAGGFRVSEICSLKWRHLQERDSTGQITVFGKGDKTRTVLMPRSVWETLQVLQQDASADAPVFKSRKKGHLDESQVWRIVTKAAERAGHRQERVLPLVSPCSCQSCPGPRLSDPPGSSHIGPQQHGDNREISARPTIGFEWKLFAVLSGEQWKVFHCSVG